MEVIFNQERYQFLGKNVALIELNKVFVEVTPSSQTGPSINFGAIVGGFVGGVAFLIILATITGCCLRRRKIAIS